MSVSRALVLALLLVAAPCAQALTTCRVTAGSGLAFGSYDLLSTAPMRLLHRGDDRLRFIELPELRARASELPLDNVTIEPSLLGMTVRFALRKSAIA